MGVEFSYVSSYFLLVKKTLGEELKEHDLNIAGVPEVKPEEIKNGEPLVYTAQFEVYPEVTLADMSVEKVERQIVRLDDKDINKMVDVFLHLMWMSPY